MRPIAAVAILTLGLLAGCGSSSPSAPTVKPTADTTVLCYDLAGLVTDVTDPITKGTLTNDEIVAGLNKYQGKIGDDAQALQAEGYLDLSTKVQAISDALGHLKVAYSNNDPASADTATQELVTAVQAIPKCP